MNQTTELRLYYPEQAELVNAFRMGKPVLVEGHWYVAAGVTLAEELSLRVGPRKVARVAVVEVMPPRVREQT